jgi:hypothetical protein
LELAGSCSEEGGGEKQSSRDSEDTVTFSQQQEALCLYVHGLRPWQSAMNIMAECHDCMISSAERKWHMYKGCGRQEAFAGNLATPYFIPFQKYE